MMNMFSGGGMMGGAWLAHSLFGLAFIIGLVLFLVWLVAYLTKAKKLLSWSIILLVIGIIGMAFTFRGGFFGMMGGNWNGGNLQGMYNHMVDIDFNDYNTSTDFRNHMLEEMQDYMGY